MHEVIKKYYANMSDAGYENAGMINNADIVIYIASFETLSPACGSIDDFIDYYFKLTDNHITEVRYQCMTDPTANVIADVICELAKGKTMQEFLQLKPDNIIQFLGCDDELVKTKSVVLLELLREKIH